jgi:hypothetical protein
MQFWRRANDGYPSATCGTRSSLPKNARMEKRGTWAYLNSAGERETGAFLMAIHKQILEWQAAHPNITWIG